MTTVPDSYFPILAKIESSGNPLAKASTSSASGLYQFLKAQWLGEGGQWGPDPSKAFGGLKPTAVEQTMRARSFTAKNAAYLAHAGVPINAATLYAAHFLGVGTATRLLASRDEMSASDLAGSAATQANPSVLARKTVGQFKQWLAAKTGAKA